MDLLYSWVPACLDSMMVSHHEYSLSSLMEFELSYIHLCFSCAFHVNISLEKKSQNLNLA